VESTAPYVALGLLYAYLLYLSWTPDTIRAMFASKYWLPEVSHCHHHIQQQQCRVELTLCNVLFMCLHKMIPAVAGHCEDVCE
jgi:hypothetical protein